MGKGKEVDTRAYRTSAARSNTTSCRARPPIGLDDALKPEIAPDGVIQREFGVVVGLLLVVELVVVGTVPGQVTPAPARGVGRIGRGEDGRGGRHSFCMPGVPILPASADRMPLARADAARPPLNQPLD